MKSYIMRSSAVMLVLAALGIAQKLMIADASGYYQHSAASLVTLGVAAIIGLLLLADLVKDALTNK